MAQKAELAFQRKLLEDLRAGGERADTATNILSKLDATAWEHILEQSLIDRQTSLFRQQNLQEDIESLLRTPNTSALLFVTDLVNFKHGVNDTHGQPVGDEIINLAAEGMRKVISSRRDDATGYRIGGDEFATLLKDGRSLERANHTAIVRRKIRGMLGHLPLVEALQDHDVQGFGVRAGATLLDANRHTSYSNVLFDADPKLNTICQYILIPDEDHLVIKKVK